MRTRRLSGGRRPVLLLVLVALAALPAAARATRVETIPASERLAIQSRFWPSLHQTLMEASQRDGVANPGVGEAERAAWDRAVAAYRANLGDRDPLRDSELIRLDEQLALIAERDGLPEGLPHGTREALLVAAPVYLARLWPEHSRGNELWIAVAATLVDRLGDELMEEHERVYGRAYPRRTVVDVTPFGGRFGAYTTDRELPHAVIGSRVSGNQGFAALEALFHEVSHTVVRPRTDAVGPEIAAAEAALGRQAHPQLWHAIQFHVSGELVRRALAAHGVAYTPMVEGRLWEGPFRGLREAVVEEMGRVIDGQAPLAEGVSRIVERTGGRVAARP